MVTVVSEARWSRTAVVAGVVMLVQGILAEVLSGLDHQLTMSDLTFGAGFVVFGGVGVVVAFHQPRNPVGWLLIFFTFFFLLGIDAQQYAVYCYLLGHRLPFASAAVLVKQSANFAFYLLPLAVFLFPDGRLTSPRWRWVLAAYAVVSGFLTASAFAPAIAAVADHDVRIDASADLIDTSRWRSPPRPRSLRLRWWRRPCSTRCGGVCKGWWTGGSTGPGTTPTGPWPRSRPG
jgi:hypothetical protein